MAVYGDLLFLINFSMDFLCFYISCYLLHQKLPTFRACIASCLGGIYSVLSLFIVTEKYLAIFIDLLVLILMCLTVYLTKNITFRKIVKGIFLYFFVSALLGGLMTALFSLFNRMELLVKDMGISEGIDVWVFAILALIGTFLTFFGGRIFRSSESRKTVMLEIESELGCVRVDALVDSGNLVSEPISGKSVAFVSVEKCKNIIDNTLYIAVKNNSNIDELPLNILSKIRVIPTKQISGEVLLMAQKFKKVILYNGKRKKEIDVYIGFVREENLSGCDAIISDNTMI